MAGPLLSVSSSGKSIRLEDLPEEAWRIVSGPSGSDDGVAEVYKKVPWVFRGVNIRAQSISKIPLAVLPADGDKPIWSSDEDKTPPAGYEWFAQLPPLIDRVERALSLDGHAYLYRRQNKFKKLRGLQYLLPRTITPKYDTDNGLVGFERNLGGAVVPKQIKVDELVYWWTPAVDKELGPGTSPVFSALAAAGLIKNIDLFAKGFFDRGATPLTLLSVEGNPAEQELRRLESWWKRTLAGVKRAFETVAVKAAVKPIVIGSVPKDLGMETLTTSKRQDIATALGIPYSILFSEATNLATAEMDSLNLWDLGLKPEAEMIEDSFNEQLFRPMGLRLEFQFSKLEVYQQREAKKAFALLALVQGGVWTPNELREQMDMPPRSDGDALQAKSALIDKQSNAELAAETARDNGAQPAGQQQRKSLELAQWQRKALKAMKAGKSAAVEFDSEVLDTSEVDAIVDALKAATSVEEVKAAFSAAPFRFAGYP